MSIYSDAETIVRKLLEDEYQTLLPETALQIGTSAAGRPHMHKFDGVSADRKIVFEVKGNGLDQSCKQPKKRYSSNIKWVLLGDIYKLSLVEAETKFLVLPCKDVFERFSKDTDGILPNGVKVVYRDVGQLGSIAEINHE